MMSAAKKRKLDLDAGSGGSAMGARGLGSRQRSAASKAATAAQAAAAGNGRIGNENVPVVSLVLPPTHCDCLTN